MTKKLILLIGTAGALVAFAVPAIANAAPSLTMPAGTLVATGSGVTATSTNTVLATPLGNLTCAAVTINATVLENTGTSWKASAAAGKSTAQTCHLGTNAFLITNIKLNSLNVSAAAKVAILTFEADLPGNLTCHFESTAGGTAVTYSAGSSSLHLAGGLVGSPEICGEEGEVEIHGDFTLSTTSGGGAVILD